MSLRLVITISILLFNLISISQELVIAGKPSQLNIRKAAENSVRITLKPLSYKEEYPSNPALSDKVYDKPFVSLRSLDIPQNTESGNIKISISNKPLKIVIKNRKNELIQEIAFRDDGKISFLTGHAPILGMGEGGPKSIPGQDWRTEEIQFDRRGRYDSMQPRWQAGAYGSRNPVPFLIGTEGWAILVSSPWVMVDLTNNDKGLLIPRIPESDEAVLQTEKNQGLNKGKGLPPADHFVPGLYDFFVFDAHDPAALMKDISLISGKAVLPPEWALGYMQSHRLLQDEQQMIGIVDTFRAKQIPLDAVIYLGTGFTPRGWNKTQPSFEFNPEVIKSNPADFLTEMHKRNTKVVLHIVPWDRDRLPALDETTWKNYWNEHGPLVRAGVDAWWPDEGDWFNLFERMKRHQLYYEGPIITQPGKRPWSLHRNGYLGIAKWGGWVWSGDTESSWKTLEGQIAVGINHSLSLSPYWGSDIGGFYPNEELTGELYARWFQFGAFCPSFRSHGRTWWTRLPWGWGLNDMGPKENKENPLQSEMNNKDIEPLVKKYDELRYQLLPYTYTLAWQARTEGLPLMRSLWLYYPTDTIARKTGDEFLWGKDLLIAPVYKKSAVSRSVYLPRGNWYDWWTMEEQAGGKFINRTVDLSILPIYVRTGAIIPFGAVKQFTGEANSDTLMLRIFSGANGAYELYEDDGISLDYLKGKYSLTIISWDDKQKELMLKPGHDYDGNKRNSRVFKAEMIPTGKIKIFNYNNKPLQIRFQ